MIANGHSAIDIDGGVRESVVERPRRGVIAWCRRRVGWLADPQPVEVVRRERVESVGAMDVEAAAVYHLTHRGL